MNPIFYRGGKGGKSSDLWWALLAVFAIASLFLVVIRALSDAGHLRPAPKHRQEPTS